jgi:glutathione S-transferase
MSATLFGVPASHPTVAAELMLKRKGIAYRRIDLVPPAHRALLRALGFAGMTVPALRLDGQRLQGSRTISRALDALYPEHPLFPSHPERRAAVEQAEAWGDEVLQPVARRLAWVALRRDRSTIRSFLEGAHLGIPTPVAVATAPPAIAMAARLNRATDAAARADLERLPGMLDRVDAWVEEGVLGGLVPNAAGYQLAPTVRLMLCFDDLRPSIDQRPSGRFARKVLPDSPAHAPPVFPAEWLAPLRRAEAVPAP